MPTGTFARDGVEVDLGGGGRVQHACLCQGIVDAKDACDGDSATLGTETSWDLGVHFDLLAAASRKASPSVTASSQRICNTDVAHPPARVLGNNFNDDSSYEELVDLSADFCEQMEVR